MFRALNNIKHVRGLLLMTLNTHFGKRTFLSPAYYCNEVWALRKTSQILSKVNADDLYYEIEQRLNKSGALSAVDVDIYANTVEDEIHVDELLDLVHKLRLHQETSNTLPSTGHAVIRYLLQHQKKEDLLNTIDDRLNYGIFLDYYTANILMDTFYKEGDFVAGCRIASQLMLQEEHDHILSTRLGILHCFNFLLKPEGWPVYTPPEEPEEEVKVRVRFLRNPFDDQHFDLKDGFKIVGKTLRAFTKNGKHPLDQSLHILGIALMGKDEEAAKSLQNAEKVIREVFDVLPEGNPLHAVLKGVQMQSENVKESLEEAVRQAEQQTSEEDIAAQHQVYSDWENERTAALDRQIERLNIARRLDNIEKTQKELETKEEKLWFFENQEKIELAIEEKRAYYPRRWFTKPEK